MNILQLSVAALHLLCLISAAPSKSVAPLIDKQVNDEGLSQHDKLDGNVQEGRKPSDRDRDQCCRLDGDDKTDPDDENNWDPEKWEALYIESEREEMNKLNDEGEWDREADKLWIDTKGVADNGSSHDVCVEVWTRLSQNTDKNGCVKPDLIDRLMHRCELSELKDQMSKLKTDCSRGRKQFMSIKKEPDTPDFHRAANSSAKSRTKRMVMSGENNIWTGAKVPYIDGTSQSIKRAMQVFERFTCIRFYPWSKEDGVTTNDKLGLNHQGYLKFIYDGGCWADQGNRRDSTGQHVSCCGGITCVHELGHALGSYHEHQNPLGKGMIRLNPENAEAGKIVNFKETSLDENTLSAGFDMSSIMAYGKTTFSNGKGEVISYEFSDIGGGSDWYYLLMEVSTSHHCDELYCSDFPMTCVNDGYLTLVDGVCGCMCPPNLDPSTGCRTTLKDTEIAEYPDSCYFGKSWNYKGRVSHTESGVECQRWDSQSPHSHSYNKAEYFIDGELPENYCRNAIGENYENWCYTTDPNTKWDYCDIKPCEDLESGESSIKWPAGQYALPQTAEGCPSDLFSTGTRVETGGATGECADTNTNACRYWKEVYGCVKNPTFMHSKCPLTCNICGLFGNHNSSVYHLSGHVTNDQVEHKFCTKDTTQTDDVTVHWPAGQYCIYRKGGACPDGFDAGSATFSDEDNSAGSNSESGSVPDGDYSSSSTKFQFCCTKYEFTHDELVLPRTKPFALLRSTDENTCHIVRGMHVYEGYTVVKNAGGSPPTLTGSVPVLELDSGKNTWKIPYCYYTPTQKDSCSEIIELSDSNPTATISAGNGENLMCNWLIMGPESTRITLKFEEMNVAAEEDGDCIDTIRVRYNRLGQSGSKFCGNRLDKVISTVNNTLEISYNTFTQGESSFRATVSLISQQNLCYSLADKGKTYAGKVDRTRGQKQCIPWAKAAHCPHSPFMDGNMVDGLTDNYCRNPDTEDGLRPWCYVEAEGCQREYCDVCMFEQLYDIASHENCAELVKNGICENDPNVLQVCARTCSHVLTTFAEPTLVNDVSCPPPASPPDGDIVGQLKDSYAVGDVVTYTCKDSSKPSAKERLCLSTGQWSSLNIVCTECELGWLHRNGNCYKLFKEEVVPYQQAVDACKQFGASLVMAKTEEEMDFLAGLDFWYGTWLAATDAVEEGKWIWSDGTAFDWTRWQSGAPDNYDNEDCVWMTRDGYMNDRWCTQDTNNYICIKPENAVTSCGDVTDDCANFYANEPTLCESQSDFMHRNCKKTCGLCSPKSCSVESPSSNAQKSAGSDVSSISQGSYVTYECKSGFLPDSGTAVRGCMADGSMTGEPLQCKPDNEVATSDVELAVTGYVGSKKGFGNVWTASPGLKIPKDGKIVKWQYWSDSFGQAAFQVWRPTGDENKLEFVGQNVVSTPKELSATYYVDESEQLTVKQGDLIAVYYIDPNSSPIGYEWCTARHYPGSEKIKVLATPNENNSFTQGQTYDFQTETKEPCRLYKVRAIVA